METQEVAVGTTRHGRTASRTDDGNGSTKGGDGTVEADPSGRYTRYNRLLGRGACKKVYAAFDNEWGLEVAWNQVELAGTSIDDDFRAHLFSEIRVLQRLKHKNIMSFHDWWYSPKQETINFITEYFTSGTLRQYRKKMKVMNENIIKRWAWQILSGLVYLHGHHPPIVHRDLKSDNIFINGETGVVKIGDLGLATAQQGLSVVGTPEFMAPEIYEECYDEKVDIYSFGMVLLELMTREYPYSECHGVAQIFKKVMTGVPPQAVSRVESDELRSLIELCLSHDPQDRPEARMLLKNPFFLSLRMGSMVTQCSAATMNTFSFRASSSPNWSLCSRVQQHGHLTQPSRHALVHEEAHGGDTDMLDVNNLAAGPSTTFSGRFVQSGTTSGVRINILESQGMGMNRQDHGSLDTELSVARPVIDVEGMVTDWMDDVGSNASFPKSDNSMITRMESMEGSLAGQASSAYSISYFPAPIPEQGDQESLNLKEESTPPTSRGMVPEPIMMAATNGTSGGRHLQNRQFFEANRMGSSRLASGELENQGKSMSETARMGSARMAHGELGPFGNSAYAPFPASHPEQDEQRVAELMTGNVGLWAGPVSDQRYVPATLGAAAVAAADHPTGFPSPAGPSPSRNGIVRQSMGRYERMSVAETVASLVPSSSAGAKWNSEPLCSFPRTCTATSAASNQTPGSHNLPTRGSLPSAYVGTGTGIPPPSAAHLSNRSSMLTPFAAQVSPNSGVSLTACPLGPTANTTTFGGTGGVRNLCSDAPSSSQASTASSHATAAAESHTTAGSLPHAFGTIWGWEVSEPQPMAASSSEQASIGLEPCQSVSAVHEDPPLLRSASLFRRISTPAGDPVDPLFSAKDRQDPIAADSMQHPPTVHTNSLSMSYSDVTLSPLTMHASQSMARERTNSSLVRNMFPVSHSLAKAFSAARYALESGHKVSPSNMMSSARSAALEAAGWGTSPVSHSKSESKAYQAFSVSPSNLRTLSAPLANTSPQPHSHKHSAADSHGLCKSHPLLDVIEMEDGDEEEARTPGVKPLKPRTPKTLRLCDLALHLACESLQEDEEQEDADGENETDLHRGSLLPSYSYRTSPTASSSSSEEIIIPMEMLEEFPNFMSTEGGSCDGSRHWFRSLGEDASSLHSSVQAALAALAVEESEAKKAGSSIERMRAPMDASSPSSSRPLSRPPSHSHSRLSNCPSRGDHEGILETRRQAGSPDLASDRSSEPPSFRLLNRFHTFSSLSPNRSPLRCNGRHLHHGSSLGRHASELQGSGDVLPQYLRPIHGIIVRVKQLHGLHGMPPSWKRSSTLPSTSPHQSAPTDAANTGGPRDSAADATGFRAPKPPVRMGESEAKLRRSASY